MTEHTATFPTRAAAPRSVVRGCKTLWLRYAYPAPDGAWVAVYQG